MPKLNVQEQGCYNNHQCDNCTDSKFFPSASHFPFGTIELVSPMVFVFMMYFDSRHRHLAVDKEL